MYHVIEMIGGPYDGVKLEVEGDVGHTVQLLNHGKVRATYHRDPTEPEPEPGETWDFEWVGQQELTP